MVELGVVTTADHRQFIGHTGQVFEDVRHLETRLAALPENALAGQHLGGARLGELQVQIPETCRQRLA